MGNRRAEGPEGGSFDEVEQVFVSTTWEWRKTKIRRPPDGQEHSRPKGGAWRSLPPRPIRDPITVTVRWRGGGECWYEITARGRTERVPGWLALHDLMQRINGHESYGPRKGGA